VDARTYLQTMIRAVLCATAIVSVAVGQPVVAQQPLTITTTGFDCAPREVTVNKIDDTHFQLRFPSGGRDKVGWFMFRIENVPADGVDLRIDLANVPIGKWKTLNPVYTYADDLADLKNFVSVLPQVKRDPIKAGNGPLLPDDSGQHWKWIANVEVDEANKTLILRQRFLGDTWVAMRPPFTPDYMDTLALDLERHPNVTVHTLYPNYTLSLEDKTNQGLQEKFRRKTPARRPYVVQIGNAHQRKPCILLYAREHADEHDTSWVAEGAIRFLLSNHPKAREARTRAVFLIVPLLDPEGAVHSIYSRITHNFIGAYIKTSETLAYAEFFHEWVNAGNRLDICFNLHNVESKEAAHFTSAYMEPEKSDKHPQGRYEHCVALHKMIRSTMKEGDIDVSAGAWAKRYGVGRLGEFAREFYGTLHMPYEVNSQAPRRHLTLFELRSVGAYMTIASVKYLYSSEAKPLVQGIDVLRARRNASFNRYKRFLYRKDVFDIEIWCQVFPGSEQRWHDEQSYPERYSELQSSSASFLRRYFR